MKLYHKSERGGNLGKPGFLCYNLELKPHIGKDMQTMNVTAPYRVQLPVFEGPLDLLLHLIEQEELDITKVALAQVTDQYLAYLSDLEQRHPKDLSRFLVVAAKLLLIKSQALLPRPATEMTPETEDVGDELVRQLQVYKRFKEIAALLHQRAQQGLHSYVRIAAPPRLEPQLDVGDATIHDLLAVVQEALDAIPAPPAGEVVSPITVTIVQQIAYIEAQLTHHPQIRFSEVLSQSTSRMEIIVTFLALLELIKQDRIQVRQERLFGEIIIAAAPPPPANAQTAAAPTTDPAA